MAQVDSTSRASALTRFFRAAAPPTKTAVSDKPVLTKAQAWNQTGYAFQAWKKWWIVTVVFLVQVSMNWNAAIFGNAEGGIRADFHLSGVQSKLGGALFLIFYAFGCELWAPFSEEFGRKWVLQVSLLLVNVFQAGCGAAKSHWVLLLCRALGGLSSAGGSVTLGMVADMWEKDNHQHGLAFVVLSSVGGSAVAPVFGGLIQSNLSWQWSFWIAVMIGVAVQLLHLAGVPETRTSCLLDKEAKRRRSTNGDNIWGPGELRGSLWSRIRTEPRSTALELGLLMWRPYHMLFTEPIVGALSLLSGFSDMLVFLGLSSYSMILREFEHFNTVEVGLGFIALLAGYVVAYVLYLGLYAWDCRRLKKSGEVPTPEQRLYWLNWLTWFMPFGLVGFAVSTFNHAHWMAPLSCLFVIGIANFAIYMYTIDYMVAAYGRLAASATGGNGFCRDFLAGTAMLWAEPFYGMAKGSLSKQTAYIPPTMTLAGLGFLLCGPVIFFYKKGPSVRRWSPMAREVMEEEEAEAEEKRQEEERKKDEEKSEAEEQARREANAVEEKGEMGPNGPSSKWGSMATTSSTAPLVPASPIPRSEV